MKSLFIRELSRGHLLRPAELEYPLAWKTKVSKKFKSTDFSEFEQQLDFLFEVVDNSSDNIAKKGSKPSS